MKNNRMATIIEIINEMEVETQEELANQLKMRGLEVTQATVSRDIKELRLIKVPSDKGGYKYASVQNNDSRISSRLIKMFAQSVLSIRSANNIIVIKTLTGSANTAAMVLDSLNTPLILGSVAGDDTIIVVVVNNSAVAEVEQLFKSMTV